MKQQIPILYASAWPGRGLNSQSTTLESSILLQHWRGLINSWSTILPNSIQLFHACSGNSQNYCPSVLEMTWELLPEGRRQQFPSVLEMTWELLPEGWRQQFPSHLQHRGTIVLTVPWTGMKWLFYYLIYMHITTNPLKMIMSAYHTINKLGHNIVLKEITAFDRNDALYIVLGHGIVRIRK